MAEADRVAHLAAVRTVCDLIIEAAETNPGTVTLHRGCDTTVRDGVTYRAANGSWGVTMCGDALHPSPHVEWGMEPEPQQAVTIDAMAAEVSGLRSIRRDSRGRDLKATPPAAGG